MRDGFKEQQGRGEYQDGHIIVVDGQAIDELHQSAKVLVHQARDLLVPTAGVLELDGRRDGGQIAQEGVVETEAHFRHLADKSGDPPRMEQRALVGLLQERVGDVAVHLAQLDHDHERVV